MKIKDNPRISPKERGLIKGAIRRVFSRSDLRRKVVDSVDIKHIDDERPRVKKWSICQFCYKYTPKYLIQVDHIKPIIPTATSLEDMDWDTLVNNVWCEEQNLMPICIECHKEKTKAERKERTLVKKLKKAA